MEGGRQRASALPRWWRAGPVFLSPPRLARERPAREFVQPRVSPRSGKPDFELRRVLAYALDDGPSRADAPFAAAVCLYIE